MEYYSQNAEIFPNKDSTNVQKLTKYPIFKTLHKCVELRPFCPYMDDVCKIHYQLSTLTERSKHSMMAFGKKAMHRESKIINWDKVRNKLSKQPDESYRMNADRRTSFKIGNCYLVNNFFTFGQRTVEEGKAHIIQTLNVPLHLYLKPKHITRLKVATRHFPAATIGFYDKRILKANTAHWIPAGVTYLLFSHQKNYFSLDVVKESCHPLLQFETIDVLKNPVREEEEEEEKIQQAAARKNMDPYKTMVETPYIDDNVDERRCEFENVFSPGSKDFFFKKPSLPPPPKVDPVADPDPLVAVADPDPLVAAAAAAVADPDPDPVAADDDNKLNDPEMQTLNCSQVAMAVDAAVASLMEENFQIQDESLNNFFQPQATSFNDNNNNYYYYYSSSSSEPLNNYYMQTSQQEEVMENYFIQNPLERIIQTTNPDFVQMYQHLKNKRMDDPRLGFPDRKRQKLIDGEAIDLSFKLQQHKNDGSFEQQQQSNNFEFVVPSVIENHQQQEQSNNFEFVVPSVIENHQQQQSNNFQFVVQELC